MRSLFAVPGGIPLFGASQQRRPVAFGARDSTVRPAAPSAAPTPSISVASRPEQTRAPAAPSKRSATASSSGAVRFATTIGAVGGGCSRRLRRSSTAVGSNHCSY